MTAVMNGTQWMLEESKRLLGEKTTPKDVRDLAAAVIELVATCRAATDERDRMARRLEALIEEIDRAPVVWAEPAADRIGVDWWGYDKHDAVVYRARLVRIEELAP